MLPPGAARFRGSRLPVYSEAASGFTRRLPPGEIDGHPVKFIQLLMVKIFLALLENYCYATSGLTWSIRTEVMIK